MITTRPNDIGWEQLSLSTVLDPDKSQASSRPQPPPTPTPQTPPPPAPSSTSSPTLPSPSSSPGSLADFFSNLISWRPTAITSGSNNPTNSQQDKKREGHNSNAPQQQITNPTPPASKRSCRAPVSKKFAHPCSCNSPSSNNHHKVHQSALNNSSSLPPAAYTLPLHLYDSISKKCLPTSRARDMLLKECRSNVASPYPLPHKLYHGAPCVYDDLICDVRRNRCVCKPSLHLYYEANNSAFGCVPLGLTASADGRTHCKQGYVYNVISKECQKIFDVNELPPPFTTGVSATQFSFVTIVLIWILLLILIVTAKLRKLKSSNLYRNSPATSERRPHRHSSYRHQNQSGSASWLHPFIAAVNGHHHLNQHRTTVDRHSQVDESGNFNDTDFFLTHGNRRMNELLPNGAFTSSQLSLNNPPPKFEEIYPSCPEEPLQPQVMANQLPSSGDLPSYDEAMRSQNTIPPDLNHKT